MLLFYIKIKKKLFIYFKYLIKRLTIKGSIRATLIFS